MMIAGSAIFCYDGNGNQIQKMDGSTTSYTYDAENHITAVSGAATATFVYDGDSKRVKGVVGGVTTTYIGNYFEWTPFGKTTLRVQAGLASTRKQYYYAGGTRVAERKGTTLYWLLSDHLAQPASPPPAAEAKPRKCVTKRGGRRVTPTGQPKPRFAIPASAKRAAWACTGMPHAGTALF
jgi:uncharacterized protein RhaS with RHS repeats